MKSDGASRKRSERSAVICAWGASWMLALATNLPVGSRSDRKTRAVRVADGFAELCNDALLGLVNRIGAVQEQNAENRK